MIRHLLVLVFLLVGLTVSAQEYEVVSFDVKPKDMTARTNSRIDANGRKCAVVKVYVDDKIATVRGSVVGEIESIGMEKQIYMAHDAKEMELVFENHYPLTISFIDYDFPSLTQQMTYILKLQSKANNLQASQQETRQNQASKQDRKPAAATTIPQKEDNSSKIEEIREKAKSEYSNGNYAKALELFKFIPDDSEVQNYLGVMYENGQGVTQDYSEAVKWYRRAADQGNVNAQINLAGMYDDGKGVTQNHSESMKWYRKAAEQGDKNSQYYLGQRYENGFDVPQDYTEAMKWFRRAAEQGDMYAQFHVGYMYYYGLGVEKDYSEAVMWYQKAAYQGHSDSEVELGNMYFDGYGVEMDLIKAKEYWTEAAKKGNETAIDYLKQYF